MKYKVGEKIRIKSIDWYNKNKDREGYVNFNQNESFSPSMSKYCGKIATIKSVDSIFQYYDIDIDKEGAWEWTDDMFDDNY